MSRQAHQTNVPRGGTRGYLPSLLNPPYNVERTPEYQARVYLYAQNYFTPAEMQDLMRIGLRFVPQEAELIKRNLRRKGDFVPTQARAVHPSETANAGLNRRWTGNVDDMQTDPLDPAQQTTRAIPPRDAAGNPANGQVLNDVLPNRNPPPDGGFGQARSYSSTSFLRRTELFIASMFVFDAAHALLAHLHQEAISLTSHGVDADDRLLKQVVRNLRGYTFRRLVPTDDAGNGFRAGTAAPALGRDAHRLAVNGRIDIRSDVIRIRDPANERLTINLRALLPEVQPDGRDLSCEDLPQPLSSNELQQLRSQGWIMRDQKYYAPIRIPQMLARYAATGRMAGRYDRDTMLRATNAAVLDPARFMGIYPVAFLTNTTLADDAVVARLIEHANSDTIDPMMFTWGMRRAVFMPLETDVADILMYSDVKTFDELHETLNAFSNGMYEGLNITGLWDGYLREKLAGLGTQVPVNQVGPFPNVIRRIEVPATAEGGGVRRTAGQEEVLRLWQKADDVLNLVNRWFLMGGNFGDVSYADYRNPGNDVKAIMGNNAAISSWGARALGMNRCGPGYEEVWFDSDPDTDPRANPQPQWVPDRSGQLTVLNPLARVAKCAPVGHSAGRIPDTGPDVRIDGTYPAYQRRSRRRAARAGRTRR